MLPGGVMVVWGRHSGQRAEGVGPGWVGLSGIESLIGGGVACAVLIGTAVQPSRYIFDRVERVHTFHPIKDVPGRLHCKDCSEIRLGRRCKCQIVLEHVGTR